MPRWQSWSKCPSYSRMRKPMTRPISSKSLMYRFPVGFSSELIRRLMSSGHSNCQTIGCSGFVPDVHTPPAPR
eukprot:13487937-Ditylum_brightwellii.AAC.1